MRKQITELANKSIFSAEIVDETTLIITLKNGEFVEFEASTDDKYGGKPCIYQCESKYEKCMSTKSEHPFQSKVMALLILINVFVFMYLFTREATSPLTEFLSYILSLFSLDEGYMDIGAFDFKLITFVLHLGCFLVILFALYALHERAFHGSFKAVLKAATAEFEEVNKLVDLGVLLRASVEDGGFFGTTFSTIETDKGIYRIFGDIGSVDKGDLVSRCGNELYVGLVKSKRYKLVL